MHERPRNSTNYHLAPFELADNPEIFIKALANDVPETTAFLVLATYLLFPHASQRYDLRSSYKSATAARLALGAALQLALHRMHHTVLPDLTLLPRVRFRRLHVLQRRPADHRTYLTSGGSPTNKMLPYPPPRLTTTLALRSTLPPARMNAPATRQSSGRVTKLSRPAPCRTNIPPVPLPSPHSKRSLPQRLADHPKGRNRHLPSSCQLHC